MARYYGFNRVGPVTQRIVYQGRSRPAWNPAHIYVHEDGTTVHSQRVNVGYGFTEYYIVGSLDGVFAAYERIKGRYPPAGYGGNYPDPVHLGQGLWLGEPRHSESCE